MIARALGWIVGSSLAQDICGDLAEERRRRAVRSRLGAVLWFSGAAIATAFVAAAIRVRHSFNTWWGRRIRPAGSRSEWRQALRSLRRTPWYALTAAGVIALSMAFAATIFAIVDGALFKPLPYRDADRVFSVAGGHARQVPGVRLMNSSLISPAELSAWRRALPDIQFTAYRDVRKLRLRGSDYDAIVDRAEVGARFFDVLGAAPLAGGFDAGDFTGSTPIRPALISYGLWQRWFGGDRSAIGRVLVSDDGSGIRIAGVLPRDFVPPWGLRADVLTPLAIPDAGGHEGSLRALARLPKTLSREQASSRLSAAGVALARTWPVPPDASDVERLMSEPLDAVSLEPIRSVLVRDTRAMSWLVFGLALFLIVLGCLNVAGLASARVQDRWRDLVLRRALGARSRDLMRPLALEHAMVVVAGTAAGVACAGPALRLTLRLMPGAAQLLKVPEVDGRVLAFAALAATACIALVTATTARAVLRPQTSATLPDAPPVWRRGPRGRRVSRWLVIGQVALALVMAVSGTLVAGSLLRVWAQDPGFDLSRTARIQVSLPTGTSAVEIEQLMAGLRRLPGVRDAGGVAGGLVQGFAVFSAFERPADIAAPAFGPSRMPIGSLPVTSGYLEAAGLQPTAGRLPTPVEFKTGAPVLVVSERVAGLYWPGRRAVGQTLRKGAQAFTVVGIVPDARYVALDRDPGGMIYFPVATAPRPYLSNVLIRFSNSSPTTPLEVVTWLRGRCSGCWVFGRPETMADLLESSIQPRTFRAWLFTSFGVASLVVVGVGIFGLVAMTSNRRTKEIGIRLALGATRQGVTQQILREQIHAVIVGLVAGGLVAAWAVRFVQSYLYKLPVYDVPAWAGAIAALLLVAGAGALIPALRASRVDPVQALRVE